MERFRLRVGDVVGIILPGIVLLLNICIIIPEITNIFPTIASKPQFLLNDVGLFFMFLVMSYIIGSALRIFTTTFPDILSRRIKIYYR
jgi:hypothetical protein